MHGNEVLGRVFRIDMIQTGDALAPNEIFRSGVFFFIGEAVTLKEAEVWVAGRQIGVFGQVCHFSWLRGGGGLWKQYRAFM